MQEATHMCVKPPTCKALKNHAKAHKNMQKQAKVCKSKRSWAKACKRECSTRNCVKARETAQKHVKLRKSTRKHAKARGSIKVFKCLVRPFQIFWLAVQKSVARFEGVSGGGVCVCKSNSMDSLLLSKNTSAAIDHYEPCYCLLVCFTATICSFDSLMKICNDWAHITYTEYIVHLT